MDAATRVVDAQLAGISQPIQGIPRFPRPERPLDDQPEGRAVVEHSPRTWRMPRGAQAGLAEPAWKFILRHGARRPMRGIARSWSSNGAASCTRSSRRTSTGCISAPGTHRTRDRSPRHGARGRLHAVRLARPDGSALDRVRAGEDDPSCIECGRDPQKRDDFFRSGARTGSDRSRDGGGGRGDVFLAVGTSLQVYPVAASRAGREARRRNSRDRQRRADATRPPCGRGDSRAIGDVLPALCRYR